MSRPISPELRDFASRAIESNGAIDVESLSPALKQQLADSGLSEAQLRAVAGPDGRIDAADEAVSLFNTVERFVGSPEQRNKLRAALLDEMSLHAVRTLTKDDALILGGPELNLVRETHLDMAGVSQFALSDDRTKAGKMCFEAAVAQLEGYFRSKGLRVPPLADKQHRIQIAINETTSGRINADTTAAQRARSYIDDCLDHERPVLIGISALSINAMSINEGITEHFVTIHGRGTDEEGRLFYEFKDPGNRGQIGRLYVDPETGKLFKPGESLATGPKVVADMLYEVSQVRTYSDLEPR